MSSSASFMMAAATGFPSDLYLKLPALVACDPCLMFRVVTITSEAREALGSVLT